MPATRESLLEAEVVRLRELDGELRQAWRRVPYLFVSFVLVAPVYALLGLTAAFATALSVPALVATAAYLIGVRRSNNRNEMADVNDALKRLG